MNEKEVAVHPFERSLGAGPYKFVGMFEINLAAGAMGRAYYDQSLVHKRFVRGAGTCAHCGHAILVVCQVQIGNGDVYGVGSDCIAKVAMPVIELTAVQKAIKAREAKKRSDRKLAKHLAAKEEIGKLIADRGSEMADMQSPRSRGSLLEYAKWCLERSTNATYALSTIKYALDHKAKDGPNETR